MTAYWNFAEAKQELNKVEIVYVQKEIFRDYERGNKKALIRRLRELGQFEDRHGDATYIRIEGDALFIAYDIYEKVNK